MASASAAVPQALPAATPPGGLTEPLARPTSRRTSRLCCWFCVEPQALDDDTAFAQYQSFTDSTEQSMERSTSETVAHRSQLSVANFDILSVLGRGTYGKVLLVKKRSCGTLYAMKVLHKADILKRNQLRHTMTERSVLQSVRHPFIVQMHYSFQNDHQLFLVMSYLAGGELFFHLRREGQLSEPRARLYAAEILLALQALHDLDIVYRDLKPENVLLDAQGHVCLSDFGLAKVITHTDVTCSLPRAMACWPARNALLAHRSQSLLSTVAPTPSVARLHTWHRRCCRAPATEWQWTGGALAP